tara:strand:- start:305 stop:529 length:225 start_codon:yes stop_codon:yes gene_type:complete
METAIISVEVFADDKSCTVDFCYGFDGITDVSKIEYCIGGAVMNFLPMYGNDEDFTEKFNESLDDYINAELLKT